MDKLFLAKDVLTSEMDELLGGKKKTVTITYTDKDGRTVSVTYTIED